MRPAEHRPAFFFVLPHVLLALVLIGFAPTLYLRTLGNPPPIPFYLHVHGLILTGWYTVLVVQAWLIRCGHSALHRTFGYWMAAYGLVVIAGGLMATLNVVARDMASGVALDNDVAAAFPEMGMAPGITYLVFISGVVWTNIGSLCAFAVLLGAAVLARRKPEWHRRFIVLAATSLMPPALARISRWEILGGENPSTVNTLLLMLIATVAIHDTMSERRIHRATLAGFLVILVCTLLANIIGGSAFGHAFVKILGS